MTRVGAVLALLALAACAVPPAPPTGPPAPAAVLTPQAPMVFPPEPAPAPLEPMPPAVVVLPPPAQPLPGPLAPPPPPTLVPADLVGKPRTDVVTVLGRPDQARTEGGAEVILYQGDSCTLFVFLYEPQAGGTHRVEHVEIGPRGRDLSRDAACLAGLLRRAAAG